MARFIHFITLLFAAYTVSLGLDNQVPLTGPIAAGESQPIAVGTRSRNLSPELACTGKQAKFSIQNSREVVVSTLLTFQYPARKFKYCWLEFTAPAVLKAGADAIVGTTDSTLICNDPKNIPAVGAWTPIGVWKLSTSGGNATWQDPSGEILNRPMRSKCPDQPGKLQGVEIKPREGTGDYSLSWLQEGKLGVRLVFSD
ncbi:hypothetical protein QBC47DRAFT_373583 [Echria macrotheca]|uniref:Ubiquitin 3 binding protein But2 C-terminal domain-containing protein n=1 Tax=Echria macrotheca TaxID=438768 RepID=A0AAJ0BIY0_9PEZI|nr:hypothetical protein QBC47DRAFT_373583 [Echria macrotheca]